MTTYAEWQAATVMPSVAEAIDLIADVQVRNRGTVGGAIAHADPASDATGDRPRLDGQAVLRGPGGERVVPLDGFFEGPFQTGIRPDEILVAIRRAGAGRRRVRLPEAGSAGVGLPDRRHRALIASNGGTDRTPRSASPASTSTLPGRGRGVRRSSARTARTMRSRQRPST